MKEFIAVLKQEKMLIILWAVFIFTGIFISFLYNSVYEPVIYSAVITLIMLIVTLAQCYYKEKKYAEERKYAVQSILTDWKNLPKPRNTAEEDYQQMIVLLGTEINKIREDIVQIEIDMSDYYTTWVHQIKTPIAVMKLKLSDDTAENRRLMSELFRIEQYVDMALQYIRLGSNTNDLVIKEYCLDEIIKEVIRKYAYQFVEKKLKLDYQPTYKTVKTDKKWFIAILEQFVSNAVKYTSSGTVAVYEAEGVLTVSDSGIGIASEDIPRIFEKGYTGNNGRIGEKSSGLGLYLAKKAADLLRIPITADSVLGTGSRFCMDIRKIEFQ